MNDEQDHKYSEAKRLLRLETARIARSVYGVELKATTLNRIVRSLAADIEWFAYLNPEQNV